MNSPVHTPHRVRGRQRGRAAANGTRAGSGIDALARFLPHLLSLTLIVGYLTGTPWAFGMVGWVQLVVPLLDQVVGVDRRPRPLHQDSDRAAAVAIWSFLPLHAVLIACGVLAVTTGVPNTHTPLSVSMAN